MRKITLIIVSIIVCFVGLATSGCNGNLDSAELPHDGNLNFEEMFPDAEFIGHFSEGLADIRIDGLWGFIDYDGNMIIEPQFEGTSMFRNGFARFHIFNENTVEAMGLIDRYGNIVVPPIYGSIRNFSEGLAAVRVGTWETGLYGFIDREGNLVIEPQFDSLDYYFSGQSEFSEGRVVMLLDGKYGAIDRYGNVIVPFIHEEMFAFNEGLAAVKIDELWGFVNLDGSMAIEPQFRFITWRGIFSEGRTRVSIDGKFGFIDREGNVVVEPQFDTVEPFRNGMAWVQIGCCAEDNNVSYGRIDRYGNFVVPMRRGSLCEK